MRFSALIMVVLFMSLTLGGCGWKSTPAEPEKGSLMRTFKLIDDQGRESGSLVLNPQGGAELLDSDGKTIGSFAPKQEVKDENAEEQFQGYLTHEGNIILTGKALGCVETVFDFHFHPSF